ncbi:hypothetical protein N7512_001256 [Penicillium capsulatum]|nr:hypothetical protein N7512_001256 [Penicillium capsulatum]
MLASLPQSLPWLGRRWSPLNFTNPSFTRISMSRPIEEERFQAISRETYSRTGTKLWENWDLEPVQLCGLHVIWSKNPSRIPSHSHYLCHNFVANQICSYCRHVTLKIFIKSTLMGQQLDDELKIYQRLEGASRRHPGRKYVRSLLDSFDINGPEDTHRCLVHPPLWESLLDFLFSNPAQRLPTPILAVTLHRLFLALDYLHTECKIIHTDIKADNIMFGIADDTVFRDFEIDELQNPCPRKELDGRTIYTSRELRMPKNLGAPILCDFGWLYSAMKSIQKTSSLISIEHQKWSYKFHGHIALTYGM